MPAPLILSQSFTEVKPWSVESDHPHDVTDDPAHVDESGGKMPKLGRDSLDSIRRFMISSDSGSSDGKGVSEDPAAKLSRTLLTSSRIEASLRDTEQNL